MEEKVAVVGLGYVGLPLALALGEKFRHTIGFDISTDRIEALKKGVDPTREGREEQVKNSTMKFTSSLEDLKDSTFIIVAVPTPIDENRQPDLSPLERASAALGKIIRPGALIVFESTVYPGVTEEFCGPILQKVSGLRVGTDFTLGYSPERINPGDTEHTLERVVKVVAAQDEKSLKRMENVYGSVVQAGLHSATSIRVAEAAKVIENTQRDLNIALMNELALIFDKMGIRTQDVLEAAQSKWNFLRFSPGLVGGHCIGVDPYYLTAKAQNLGYHPQVILAGRRINDDMGRFIASKVVKLLIQSGVQPNGAKVGVIGVTFKENVSDIRNSRVPDILKELQEFGVKCLIHDPLAEPDEVAHEYKIQMTPLQELNELDALVLAVPHRAVGLTKLPDRVRKGGVLIDVKSALKPDTIRPDIHYWSL